MHLYASKLVALMKICRVYYLVLTFTFFILLGQHLVQLEIFWSCQLMRQDLIVYLHILMVCKDKGGIFFRGEKTENIGRHDQMTIHDSKNLFIHIFYLFWFSDRNLRSPFPFSRRNSRLKKSSCTKNRPPKIFFIYLFFFHV